MPEFKNKKKGFTLLEVLIVIAIIATLSALAVAGYSEYRKSSLLSLSADSIVSQIKELKSDTIFGDFEGGTPACFGFSFREDEDGFRIVKFSQEYKGKKVWDNEEIAFVYKGCDDDINAETVVFEDFELDSLVKVISVIYKGDEITSAGLEDLYIRFAPPNGQISSKSVMEPAFAEPTNELNAKLIINIKYGFGEDDRYEKAIEFDLRTL